MLRHDRKIRRQAHRGLGHRQKRPTAWRDDARGSAGQHVFVGFEEELRSVAADNGEKRIPIRLLESRLKTKLIAVEGDSLIDVADDEEWGNRLRRWSCHMRTLIAADQS